MIDRRHWRARRTTTLAACLAAALGTTEAGLVRRASAAPPVRAVANCNDAGPGSLRRAVADAVDGETIDLGDLTCPRITLTSGAIYTERRGLTLQGRAGKALVVDGAHASAVLDKRRFGTLTLVDLTIANGRSSSRGGCLSIIGDLVLVRSTVTGCEGGTAGGGIYVHGDLTMIASQLTRNTVTSAAGGNAIGGGAWVVYTARLQAGSVVADNEANGQLGAFGGGLSTMGNVRLEDSRISNNRAITDQGTAAGGGIQGNLDIELLAGSTVTGNTAQSSGGWSYGGGLAAVDPGLPNRPRAIRIQDSTLDGNIADCSGCSAEGGGAYAAGAIGVLNGTLRDNQALAATVARGGGLAASGAGAIDLRNSTLSGNSARATGSGSGGGLSAQGNPLVIVGSTIAFNQASHAGGAIADSGGTVILQSSLIADNAAPDGADIAALGGPLTLTGGHNLVRAAGAGVDLPADTLSADPQLLPLADNGGPTATHALAPTSPAIDAGSNPDDYAWDQRGAPFARVSGRAADIGAFEWQGGDDGDADGLFADGFDPHPAPR